MATKKKAPARKRATAKAPEVNRQSGDWDYNVKLKARDPRDRATSLVGRAWAHDNGSISIQLLPGTCITYETNQEFMLTLWPAD